MTFRSGRTFSRFLPHILLIVALVFILFPVYYIVLTSIRPSQALSTDIWPRAFSLDNWKYVLGLPYYDQELLQVRRPDFPILLWLWNSIKISGFTAFLVVLFSTSSAYALSRFQFVAKKKMLMGLMIFQMFPSFMAMVAIYLMINHIGEVIPWLGLDTHGGLILIYLATTPFFMWLIKGYFDNISPSVEEAALIDGCTRFQAFYKILIPQSLPILFVVGLIVFIQTFADFILPSILLKSQDKLTLAVGMRFFIEDKFTTRWGPFAAASVLASVPVALIFLSVNRYIVSGLTAGGTKE